ncbi:zinc dependent phospholipase C family protein [Clostridium swellfunianum]|uniref:zinc dependent phospholipase C family protein n=1 Tax=Clostridium swellfunianum TaxID=1367462 RepID=UPI00202F56E3|nr:zinc dependent phospholipase C family protein [Clostridium swellfunianum]MCM0648461.1 zinc dependent phospholipase C family protein [Clostridium swellfunianum]
MRERIEKTYGSALRGVMYTVNPIKKKIIKTHCIIHKFLNLQAIAILKNEGYVKEYEFFKENITPLNEGVAWADQDFKSSNHFYHFSKGKGLYGFSDALTECKRYYSKSLAYMKFGETDKAMFFLGASCHLIQDMTVPHHVNNRLLDSHRNFEMWIIKKFMSDYSFLIDKGIIRYKTVDDYIRNNALMANNIHLKYLSVQDKEERYGKIAAVIIKEAQNTTAGLLLDYYDTIYNK